MPAWAPLPGATQQPRRRDRCRRRGAPSTGAARSTSVPASPTWSVVSDSGRPRTRSRLLSPAGS